MAYPRRFLPVCLIGAAFLFVTKSGSKIPDWQREESRTELRALLRERRDTLRQLYQHAVHRYKAGTLGEEYLTNVADKLFEAELELTETSAGRVELCEKRICELRNQEDLAKMRFDNGVAPSVNRLEAKEKRLQAEIRLAREKSPPQGSAKNTD